MARQKIGAYKSRPRPPSFSQNSPYKFILMDDDNKPYTKHEINMLLAGYLPNNIPKVLHESFLMHIYEKKLNIPKDTSVTLKPNVLYEFDNLVLDSDSNVTMHNDRDNEKQQKMLLNIKHDLVLDRFSEIQFYFWSYYAPSHGSIKIKCDKLIIERSSRIICYGEAITKDTDGIIHITCNELTNHGRIECASGGHVIIDCDKIIKKGDIHGLVTKSRKRKNIKHNNPPKKRRKME